MARRGKYKSEAPDSAAGHMLKNLIDKIPQMKTNYSTAMDRFASDTSAQNRYMEKVSAWIEQMRTAEVADLIAKAIEQAKSQYRKVVRTAARR